MHIFEHILEHIFEHIFASQMQQYINLHAMEAQVQKGWLQNAKLKKIQKDKSDLGATWVSQ